MNITLLRTITFGITAAITISSSANTIFYYQGDQISAITSQQQPTSFVLVNGQRIATVSTSASKSAQFYIGDKKNQAMLISGQQADTTPHSADYHAYGKALNALTQNAANNFTYNGEYQDPTTQLTYLRARDYDASQQRFVSMDSYHVWNRYNFTDANPIMNIDPSGHLSKMNGLFALIGVGSLLGQKYLANSPMGSEILNIGLSVLMLATLPASWEAGLITTAADVAFLTSSVASVGAQIDQDANNTTDAQPSQGWLSVAAYAGYAGMGLNALSLLKGGAMLARDKVVGYMGNKLATSIGKDFEEGLFGLDHEGSYNPFHANEEEPIPMRDYASTNDMLGAINPRDRLVGKVELHHPENGLQAYHNFVYDKRSRQIGLGSEGAFNTAQLDGPSQIQPWVASRYEQYDGEVVVSFLE